MTGSPIAEVLRGPVIIAPMGGGPSTPTLVLAGAKAGALGFLAAAYKNPSALDAEMEAVRSGTDEAFGVNLFVPGAPTDDVDACSRYLESLDRDAGALGVELGDAAWNDDDYVGKLEVLLEHPPAVVSFTFGCPSLEVVAALHAAGSQVWVTVTDEAEAAVATRAGADALCVQGPEAGGHRATFDGARAPGDIGLLELLGQVRRATELPLVGAGGVMDSAVLKAARAAGAVAVQCGTAFLRCPESGAGALHKAMLADGRFSETAVTRAFSGRAARGLLNQFMLDHDDAPAAYPEINAATRPLRSAATAAGDAQRMSLWAGTGFHMALERPVAEIIEHLTGT